MIHKKLMFIPAGTCLEVPSHCLYADDVMIFCRGNKTSISPLIFLFDRYAKASGQVVNSAKSNIFAGSLSDARLHHIANLLGFKTGVLPFKYLGIPIFKCKQNDLYFKPIVDKIKTSLSAWKGSLLSFVGWFNL